MLHMRFCVLEQILNLPRGDRPECGEFLEFMSKSLNPISWMCLDFGVLGANFASEPYVGVSGLVMALARCGVDQCVPVAREGHGHGVSVCLWMYLSFELLAAGCRNDTSR